MHGLDACKPYLVIAKIGHDAVCSCATFTGRVSCPNLPSCPGVLLPRTQADIAGQHERVYLGQLPHNSLQIGIDSTALVLCHNIDGLLLLTAALQVPGTESEQRNFSLLQRSNSSSVIPLVSDLHLANLNHGAGVLMVWSWPQYVAHCPSTTLPPQSKVDGVYEGDNLTTNRVVL